MVNAPDRRTDVTDRGPMPNSRNSRNRHRVPCRKRQCVRTDVLAIRKLQPTRASAFLFCFVFFKMNVRVFFNSCVCFVFRLIQGLRWIRTLPASLATSLAVRACRKNGTPRWTPRTRTPTKGIRNSGWLHSSFTLLPF